MRYPANITIPAEDTTESPRKRCGSRWILWLGLFIGVVAIGIGAAAVLAVASPSDSQVVIVPSPAPSTTTPAVSTSASVTATHPQSPPDASSTRSPSAQSANSVTSPAPSASPKVFFSSAPSIAPASSHLVSSKSPSVVPLQAPSDAPTEAPTRDANSSAPSVSVSPREFPTSAHSVAPLQAPASSPTAAPTRTPSMIPEALSTVVPVSNPSVAPLGAPSVLSTAVPSSAPFVAMTAVPTSDPFVPTTAVPSSAPFVAVTAVPTSAPFVATTAVPTSAPSPATTTVPTSAPSVVPTAVPTSAPSPATTAVPTSAPSTAVPTSAPSVAPSASPMTVPSSDPTVDLGFDAHLAHAVAGGPYTVVDVDDTGFASVEVNAVQSHTHGPGLSIIEWIWNEGETIVGTGEMTSLRLSVGEHAITLVVKDGGGNKSKENTTVTVKPAGNPVIGTLTPDSGDIVGGSQVTVKGSGFSFTESETIVHFGSHNLTGASQITIVNKNTIVIKSVPPEALAVPVAVSISTPISESNKATFSYISGSKIDWTRGSLFDIYGPTTVAFGPDEKLYIGTSDGEIAKLKLQGNSIVLESLISTIVTHAAGEPRVILGIAFDPLDTNLNPALYVSHSATFHGESDSSGGGAINGKVSRVSGQNLDIIDDIITGLPVSDHDHAVNGLQFGDDGELYIAIGGNTNGGVMGPLSGTRLQEENVLSAAILVAYLSNPTFDGAITYDANDNGNQVGGLGSVDVFASGIRNPFDLVFHSNGKIYCTDNGPNLSYGAMSISCNGGKASAIPDITQEDKLNLITQGNYYGHPNRKRAEKDPRQCIWRSALESSGNGYTAPLAELPSSSNGIVEWQTAHFGGQLRNNLIVSKYKGGLYRVVLTADGTQVANSPFLMHDDGGLDVTQGPDGTLFTAMHKRGKIRYVAPLEAASSSLVVKSVFPRRGSQSGGSVLNVYGENFGSSSGALTVFVGGSACNVLTVTSSKITCTLPGGSGVADILVSTNGEASTFFGGYRYISGLP